MSSNGPVLVDALTDRLARLADRRRAEQRRPASSSGSDADESCEGEAGGMLPARHTAMQALKDLLQARAPALLLEQPADHAPPGGAPAADEPGAATASQTLTAAAPHPSSAAPSGEDERASSATRSSSSRSDGSVPPTARLLISLRAVIHGEEALAARRQLSADLQAADAAVQSAEVNRVK